MQKNISLTKHFTDLLCVVVVGALVVVVGALVVVGAGVSVELNNFEVGKGGSDCL